MLFDPSIALYITVPVEGIVSGAILWNSLAWDDENLATGDVYISKTNLVLDLI
jgi:hypothetical protein